MMGKKLLDVATEAALASGDKIVEYLGHPGDVEFKREKDMVTKADRLSEEIIITKIRQDFPKHHILAEERGLVRGNGESEAEYTWVVDPLDGTTNFAHGVPMFAVSIGVIHSGVPVIGVVYNPVSKELFRAELGQGAFLNEEAISVSSVSSICHSLVGTGFPYDMEDEEDNNVRDFCRVVAEVQDVRRMGVASLDLAYVACGRFDAYWEPGLAPWDVAAGAVLVREAGGMATDYEGREFILENQQIVASNGIIHTELLRLLRTKRSIGGNDVCFRKRDASE